MTTIDVQPSIYYTAAAALHQAAVDLASEVQGKWGALSGCASMAGSYEEARGWATSYDTQSNHALDAATALASTMDAYAGALRTLGFNHATADYNATIGTKGTAPQKPATPIPAVTVCQVPPPSAGGPGNGLTDVVKLAEKVGITIPDGDTGKLGAIGDTWAGLKAAKVVGGLSDEIGRIINSVSLIKSPETDTVLADLRDMQGSAVAVAVGFGDLADSCHGHKAALDDLRRQLEKQLEDLAKELIKEIGISLAITVGLSFVTFGVGALVEAARVARIVEKFAGPIKDMVQSWKAGRDLKKGVKTEQELDKEAAKLRKLEQRINDSKETDWLRGGVKLTDKERRALEQGPTSRDGKNLTEALREGKLTKEQEQEVEDLDQALSKCEVRTGWLTRQTNLTPEQLDRYVPRQPVTEPGYTSMSTNPAGVGNGMAANTTNTEFKILSKTASDYSQYGTPDEAIYPSGKTLTCVSKVMDRPNHWKIVMMEK